MKFKLYNENGENVMKCPKCGNEVKGRVCKYCHIDLPFDERAVSLSQFTVKFISAVNTVLFPPAKGMFVLWTLCWITGGLSDNATSFPQKICIILFGYILMCGVADLIYMKNKKRYLAYKLKIAQKEMTRLKKLMNKFYPYKDLLDEANSLADIANTTTNEEVFERCYNRLVEVLTELKKYECWGVFTNSPTEDLNNLIYGRDAAIKKLHERQVNSSNSRSKATPIYMLDADPLFIEAANIVVNNKKAAIGALQRQLKIGFNRAMKIMNQLEAAKIVGPEVGTAPRTVLVDSQTLQRMLAGATLIEEENTPIDIYAHESKNDYKTFDDMSGLEFESYCARILESNGFTNIEVTQGSGDHGIDILAEKDDISYAIQCKCYTSNIGNAAVQQAHTGKSLYKKDVAVVLTNRYFTQQAKSEAQQLGVKLWDRDKLQQLIDST